MYDLRLFAALQFEERKNGVMNTIKRKSLKNS